MTDKFRVNALRGWPHAHMSTTSTRRPRVLAGRYRMQEVIGRGGMSTVYRATDSVLGRVVAVKVLLPALAESDPSYIARFQREARAAGCLRHPAVVKIYDTGTDDGVHYIVMEYVAGRGLDRILRDGRLDRREVARIGSEVAAAVAAAHAAGVLHRDIKPANVIIGPDGSVKVLDFGIARTVEQTTVTKSAFAIGTVAYMPPERVLGRPGDERSDVYGIGCLLYALLTGRPPFEGDEAMAILHHHVHAQPVPPSAKGASVSPGLDRLVMRMLAKDPADRPQSAAEVAGLLSAAAGSGEAALAAPAAFTRPTMVLPGVRDHRRRAFPLAALALTALTALVVALVAFGGGSAKRAGASASVQRTGARLGRAAVLSSGVHRATVREATRSAATGPSAAAAPSSTAALPPGHAKKDGPGPPGHLPPGQAKKDGPGPPGHVPPGHGGPPPGQGGKGGNGGD